MVAPGHDAAPASHDERTAKLDQYVERLSRYLTAPLTERLFDDEDVNDVQINSDGLVWLDRRSAGRVQEGDILPPERVEMFVNAVAQFNGLTFDGNNSILEGELPLPVFNGARFIAFGPPTAIPAALVIRKPPRRVITLDEYVQAGALTSEQYDALLEAVVARRNIVVCGAMGSGKTTFLGALLHAMSVLCPAERLLLIEDRREVRSSVRNTQYLKTSQRKDWLDVLRGSLSASADRIAFGEIRGKEILAALDAWESNHPGFATFHAADPEGAVERMNDHALRNRVPSQRKLIGRVVNVLVFIEGSGSRRRVREVVRVDGFDARERRFSFHRLG